MGLSAHVPDLAALEVLLGVARTGSLNSAAGQIGVSQQAVSARIRAMEAQTGVALVRRSPRGSSLTAEGAVIAEWAARLLDVAGEDAVMRLGQPQRMIGSQRAHLERMDGVTSIIFRTRRGRRSAECNQVFSGRSQTGPSSGASRAGRSIGSVTSWRTKRK